MTRCAFIFMLTADDRTVADCLAVLDCVAPLGLGHIGFKDVGADPGTLAELNRRIHQAGARSYLEMVDGDIARQVETAHFARAIGVDGLCGGVAVRETLAVLAGSGVRYYPFVGRPVGHPTRLHGTPETVAEDCRQARALGCDGVDLLAYRAQDADPLELVRAARAASDGQLIVAGSIDSPGRIAALAAAGADAFTIGSAVFDRRFSSAADVAGQLRDVVAACS